MDSAGGLLSLGLAMRSPLGPMELLSGLGGAVAPGMAMREPGAEAMDAGREVLEDVRRRVVKPHGS